MDKIEELLNAKKNDRATPLQLRALTDKSYKNKTTHSQNNDEINFELATYGDAVLKLALCKVYRDKKTYGDAILKCVLCKIYFEREDEDNFGFKGKLTEWKKQYESDEVLVQVIAKHYNLLGFLRYDEKGNGKPEEQKPKDYEYKGRNEGRHKYIATAMEACIAAVYIENGENEVIEIVKQWIEWIDKVTNSSDT